MPPKAKPRTAEPESQPRNTAPSARQASPGARYSSYIPTSTMATEVQTTRLPGIESFGLSGGAAIPSYQQYPSISSSPGYSPTAASRYGIPPAQSIPLTPRAAELSRYAAAVPLLQTPQPMPMRPFDPPVPQSPGIASTLSSPDGNDSQRGVKRRYEDMAMAVEGYVRNLPAGYVSLSPYRELSDSRPDRTASRLPPSPYDPREPRHIRGFSSTIAPTMTELGSVSSVSTPSGTTSSFPILTNPAVSRRQSSSSAHSNTHRLSLYMRQQPRAARAGPDGRDRRSLDPPPVIQLLIQDFDPSIPSDLAELKHQHFVVHCRLISAQSPRKDVSTLAKVTEDGSKEIQRLLLGTAVSSPFHCTNDPDPENAPEHPTSDPAPPDSPTAFLFSKKRAAAKDLQAKDKGRESDSSEPKAKGKEKEKPNLPATFFIFADLSVRKAGDYRLEFSLMKVESALLIAGATIPTISTITSSVFKVVNAKDFDQVQPSTNLVKGLLERGAGFPLKLKKGTREGQRVRRVGGEDGSVGEDGEDEVSDEG